MSWARLSLFYLAGYLSATGIAFLLLPQGSLLLFGATGQYGSPFVQFTGAFMIALSVIVMQIIRLDLVVLHKTTVAIRLFFIGVIWWLFATTKDPMFLVVLAVVTLGVVLTVTGLLLDQTKA